MYGYFQIYSSRMRWYIIGFFALLGILLSFSLIPTPQASKVTQTPVSTVQHTGIDDAMMMYDDPNALVNLGSYVMDQLNVGLNATERGFDQSGTVILTGASKTGKFVAHGLYSGITGIGHGIAATFRFASHTTGTIVVSTLQAPVSILQVVSDAPVVSSVIKPADHMETVPVIDPDSPALLAAREALPATEASNPAAPQSAVTVAWPIHGAVTTEFGVSDWP